MPAGKFQFICKDIDIFNLSFGSGIDSAFYPDHLAYPDNGVDCEIRGLLGRIVGML